MSKPIKIIIAGSRSFDNYNKLSKYLNSFIYGIIPTEKHSSIEIVSGGARGADRLGEKYAEENNVSLKKFPANWRKHGKAAGPIRNGKMAEYADVLIAFWDGSSPGTKDMIAQAVKHKLSVHIYPF